MASERIYERLDFYKIKPTWRKQTLKEKYLKKCKRKFVNVSEYKLVYYLLTL